MNSSLSNRRRPLLRKLLSSLAGALLFLMPQNLSAVEIQVKGTSMEMEPAMEARPWAIWYWMQAGITREGIRADLAAMEEIGLGGAFLMPIQGVTDPPHVDPPVEQLTPEFWEMVRFAMEEAEKRGIPLGMHACDGFAVAGGPWVTPELSMQELVWSKVEVTGGDSIHVQLPQPETREGYYRDIAVYAFPSLPGSGMDSSTIQPEVTSSIQEGSLDFLLDEANKEPLRQYEPGWIQYTFDEPFTCRSIRIRPHDRNYQAMRLLIQVSDDGEVFRDLLRLEPPRHGWQSMGIPVTWSLPETTARYFRFVFNPEGSEPGAEDLDFAKWSPNLKVRSILLSGEPAINQIEGKNGSVWRIAGRTPESNFSNGDCVTENSIHIISKRMAPDGRVELDLPPGQWTLLRMGHTSTGQTNATAGAGMGLEIDKFSVQAAELQFDKWFGEAARQAGPELAGRVLKVFHLDSWECGSQNWTVDFAKEFEERRGYSLVPYLPVIAGIPVESADVSETFLLDFRKTISELLVDRFFQTMHRKAADIGCTFTAESVAPTMVSDSLRHFGVVDVPMGEFWLRSPTHDKPNDILDAISGGHIYGKPLIQAEAFTQLRIAWDEHPSMLKTLADRHFALGINRMAFHVFTLNPWMDRIPGMTLNGVGLYFQRDQTWWKPGKAFVEYLTRCQALLQEGRPVVDVAVFTGEDIPSRSLLPEDLTGVLPGILGPDRIQDETERLSNEGCPLQEMPKGVKHSANIRNPHDWFDPLRGYKYDSINPDALLRLAHVEEGRILLPGGMSYQLLVIPGERRTAPNAGILSLEVAEKLAGLIEQGATVLLEEKPCIERGLAPGMDVADRIETAQSTLERAVVGPWIKPDFSSLGLERDLIVRDPSGQSVESIDWTHRTVPGREIYFITNQAWETEPVKLSFRVSDAVSAELFDPVANEVYAVSGLEVHDGRMNLSLVLGPGESRFVLFKASEKSTLADAKRAGVPRLKNVIPVSGPWTVQFDKAFGGPEVAQSWDVLTDWSTHPDFAIRHYSGTATYCTDFSWTDKGHGQVWLNLGEIHNLGTVFINGRQAGTAWTWPCEVRVDSLLQNGSNHLCIEVTNTWANRLIGDHSLPEKERLTRTTAPYRLQGSPLLPAGLIGPVTLREKTHNHETHANTH